MEKEQEQNEPVDFPVDIWPLIRTGGLLLVVFGALCGVVAFVDNNAIWIWGIPFLAFVVCISAYTQRHDQMRVIGILVGGAVLCLLAFLLSGTSDGNTPEPDPGEAKPKNSTNYKIPEGF